MRCSWRSPSASTRWAAVRGNDAVEDRGHTMSGDASSVSDPRALIRSAQYRSLLVLAAVVGLFVSTAAWLFLESVHEIEVWVYQDLPHHAGYDGAMRDRVRTLLRRVSRPARRDYPPVCALPAGVRAISSSTTNGQDHIAFGYPPVTTNAPTRSGWCLGHSRRLGLSRPAGRTTGERGQARSRVRGRCGPAPEPAGFDLRRDCPGLHRGCAGADRVPDQAARPAAATCPPEPPSWRGHRARGVCIRHVRRLFRCGPGYLFCLESSVSRWRGICNAPTGSRISWPASSTVWQACTSFRRCTSSGRRPR